MSDLGDPRVLFAAERTLLAWNRTSLSLIAFGFLVERSGLLLPAVPETDPGSGAGVVTFWVGLAFIALGIFTTYFSTRQYISALKTLNPSEIPEGYMPKWGLVVNGAVGILGAALCVVLYLGRV
jgi:putative membrane protein